MRLAFVPRTTEFYKLFADAGQNAVAVAKLVERRFREYPDTSVTQGQVKALEHEGDGLTREIITLLNTQYVTPFDREDIYQLAGAIDDVVDYIEEASDLLGLYKVEGPMRQALEQCRVLVSATEGLAAALSELRRVRNVEPYLVEVKRLEDEGDLLLRDALASLFEDGGGDPLLIIRWKDIFEALEDAVDACETVADVVGNIALKNT